MSGPAAAPPGRPRRWRWLALLAATLVVVVVLPSTLALAAWLARDALATRLVGSLLEDRGARCAPLEVHVEGAFRSLELQPARCGFDEGSIAELSFAAPIRVELGGTSVRSIDVGELALVRRAPTDPLRSPDELGDWLASSARVGGLLFFAWRLSRDGSPSLRAARVRVSASGAASPDMVLVGLGAARRDRATPMRLTVEEIDLSALEGPLGLRLEPRLREVVVEVAGAGGSIEGTLDAGVSSSTGGPIQLGPLTLGAFTLGSLVGERRLRVEAAHLDATPSYAIELR